MSCQVELFDIDFTGVLNFYGLANGLGAPTTVLYHRVIIIGFGLF